MTRTTLNSMMKNKQPNPFLQQKIHTPQSIASSPQPIINKNKIPKITAPVLKFDPPQQSSLSKTALILSSPSSTSVTKMTSLSTEFEIVIINRNDKNNHLNRPVLLLPAGTTCEEKIHPISAMNDLNCHFFQTPKRQSLKNVLLRISPTSKISDFHRNIILTTDFTPILQSSFKHDVLSFLDVVAHDIKFQDIQGIVQVKTTPDLTTVANSNLICVSPSSELELIHEHLSKKYDLPPSSFTNPILHDLKNGVTLYFYHDIKDGFNCYIFTSFSAYLNSTISSFLKWHETRSLKSNSFILDSFNLPSECYQTFLDEIVSFRGLNFCLYSTQLPSFKPIEVNLPPVPSSFPPLPSSPTASLTESSEKSSSKKFAMTDVSVESLTNYLSQFKDMLEVFETDPLLYAKIYEEYAPVDRFSTSMTSKTYSCSEKLYKCQTTGTELLCLFAAISGPNTCNDATFVENFYDQICDKCISNGIDIVEYYSRNSGSEVILAGLIALYAGKNVCIHQNFEVNLAPKSIQRIVHNENYETVHILFDPNHFSALTTIPNSTSPIVIKNTYAADSMDYSFPHYFAFWRHLVETYFTDKENFPSYLQELRQKWVELKRSSESVNEQNLQDFIFGDRLSSLQPAVINYENVTSDLNSEEITEDTFAQVEIDDSSVLSDPTDVVNAFSAVLPPISIETEQQKKEEKKDDTTIASDHIDENIPQPFEPVSSAPSVDTKINSSSSLSPAAVAKNSDPDILSLLAEMNDNMLNYQSKSEDVFRKMTEDYRTLNTDLQNKLLAMTESISTTLASQKKEIDSLSHELTSAKGSISTLQIENVKMANEILILTSKLDSSNEHIQQLESSVSEKIMKLQEHVSENSNVLLDHLAKKEKDIVKKHHDLTSKIDNHVESLGFFENNLEGMKQRLDLLNELLEEKVQLDSTPIPSDDPTLTLNPNPSTSFESSSHMLTDGSPERNDVAVETDPITSTPTFELTKKIACFDICGINFFLSDSESTPAHLAHLFEGKSFDIKAFIESSLALNCFATILTGIPPSQVVSVERD